MVRSSQDDGVIKTNCVIRVIGQMPSVAVIRLYVKCRYTVTIYSRKFTANRKINSFFAKLDFEAKFSLIYDTYSLKNVFKHKEQQQILHQYGVVYEINCNCGSSYFGQTSRNLITRINNHDPSSKTP